MTTLLGHPYFFMIRPLRRDHSLQNLAFMVDGQPALGRGRADASRIVRGLTDGAVREELEVQAELSRDDIARAVQGHDRSPLHRSLDGHVARLRRKLEGVTNELRIIKSVRSVGYVFASDVSSR